MLTAFPTELHDRIMVIQEFTLHGRGADSALLFLVHLRLICDG